MTSRIVCILNLAAGTSSEIDLDELVRAFERQRVDVLPVKEEVNKIPQIAREAARWGAKVVIAAGGDGTVSSVGSGLVDTDAALAVLPLGTLNHFAKDLRIPLQWESALEIATCGNTERIDVGEVNGRIFINNSSIGVYPRIVIERRTARQRGYGWFLALCSATIATFQKLPKLQVKLMAGGQKVVARTPFIFVGNNRYEMKGLDFGTRPELVSGELQVVVAGNVGRFKLALAAWQALWRGEEAAACVETFHSTELTIDTWRRRLPVAIDGEVIELESPLMYRSRPRALTVVVPAREEKAA